MIKDMIIKRIAELKNEIHEIEMLEKTLPKEELIDGIIPLSQYIFIFLQA